MKIRKILIVEDSELLHKMYEIFFINYVRGGTIIIHSFNGLEGLSKLNEHPDTQLIILDINMPVMSGLEFLIHCQKEKVFREIPVIIVSSEGKEQDTLRGLKAGAKGYLTKPFNQSDLHGLIERIMPAGSPGDESRVAGINA